MEKNKKTVKQEPDVIRLQDMLYLCLRKWYWFVLSLLLCVGVAVVYLLRTPSTYTTTAAILIKDDSKGKSASPEMESFGDFGLFTSSTNVNNEMQSLRSSDLMHEVVARLRLDMDYQVKGRFHKQTLYGEQLPVTVTIEDTPGLQSTSFTLTLKKDSGVALSDFILNGEEIGTDKEIAARLNDTVNTPAGNMVITPSAAYQAHAETEIFVSRIPVRSAIGSYSSRLSVMQNDEKSNVINLSFTDVSTRRGEDVLNTLIAIYNENWVKDKNQIAVSTSMFINDRLGVIEGELGNVDDDISSYKSEHLLPDVQAAASMYMTQANEADMTIKALNNQAYMARYIRNYLTNEANKFELLPVNSGIDNSNIATQIAEYNNQLRERNSLVSHSSVKSPLVVEMDAQLAATRGALLTSIDNQLVALNAQISSQQGYSGQIRSQIASNPKQAKYLLSVERQQKVKESLYLYLLQKREENELSQAFTAYNTRIVKKPEGGMLPTAPVRKNILLAAFALGLLIPFVLIFLRENLNTKVRGRKDLENLTVPFVGEIPLFLRKKQGRFSKKPKEAKAIVVKEGKRDVINEAFRVLRTNLEFMTEKGTDSNVLVVTSFNPGSGKTFLTMNIAMSLAIKEKKVLMIDGDLRHGSTSAYVDSPAKGLSDYLNGRVDKLEEILVSDGKYDNLHILPIGTVPPNPTELLFKDRMKQIIDEVRGRYDYIFIDCPPIELVADTQILEKLADRTIFVVRAGLLERSMLTELQNIYDEKTYKNMSLILNGTEGSGGRYGYGYRYGYHYGYGYGYHYGSDKSKMKGVNGRLSGD